MSLLPTTFQDWLDFMLSHVTGGVTNNVNFAALASDLLLAEIGPGKTLNLHNGVLAVIADAANIFPDAAYRDKAVFLLKLFAMGIPAGV